MRSYFFVIIYKNDITIKVIFFMLADDLKHQKRVSEAYLVLIYFIISRLACERMGF